jgi:hypothetical protein
MKCKISTAIKADKRKLTAYIGKLIVAELAKGDVKDLFWHLKGWYRTAMETQAWLCRQTIEHQTDEREELYLERAAYGKHSPQTGCPMPLATINQLMASCGLQFPC